MTAIYERHDEPDRVTAVALQCHDGLLRFVARRVRRAEAADIVQDAYLRLVSAAERNVIHNPKAFLFATVRNLLKDRARTGRAQREVAMEDVSREPHCPAPSSDRVVIARQHLEIVERALTELQPKRRAALVLHRIDGLSQAEIADRLGLSVSMVEKHIRAALDHCRKRLGEAGYEAER